MRWYRDKILSYVRDSRGILYPFCSKY